MDTEQIKNMMKERLSTKALAEEAARFCDISVATIYRYKSDPSQMPISVAVKLAEYLGYPLEESASWSRSDPLLSENRRLQLETELSESGGDRLAITTAYAVTCELPELRRCMWDADYGCRHAEKLEQYISIRMRRSDVYKGGRYKSFEIIMAQAYRDFFNCKGLFSCLSTDLRDKQMEALIASLDFPHVRRRVYLQNTPELPVFQAFGEVAAVIRVDDIIFEYRNRKLISELTDVFHDYYSRCDLKTHEAVREFYRNPNVFMP
jgi:hypothetical protein